MERCVGQAEDRHKMRKADLHIHSYYSTGRLRPKVIMAWAAEKGISFISITDYNSVSGLEEAVTESNSLPVHVIQGIELPAVPADILAYFIDYKSEGLQKKLTEISRCFEDEIIEQIESLR
ncbi:MAG: PHP domain-containing protein, partial [Candidatus Woesearchaeota archaeon]